jgi:uncharacterized membrane protein
MQDSGSLTHVTGSNPPRSGRYADGAEPGQPRQEGGLLSDSARVEAFSDGVLAIVITLLVLDLRAPDSSGHMLHQLLQQWPSYLAYLASFGYVGVIWVNHHQLFTRIDSVDSGLLWRNLALLLVTSALPFPTAVVSSAFEYGDHQDEVAALVMYNLEAALMALTWLVLFHYLAANERLLASGTSPAFFARERQRAFLGVASYLIAAGAAPWQPIVSLAIIVVLPVFYGLTSEGWTRLPGWPAQPL